MLTLYTTSRRVAFGFYPLYVEPHRVGGIPGDQMEIGHAVDGRIQEWKSLLLFAIYIQHGGSSLLVEVPNYFHGMPLSILDS